MPRLRHGAIGAVVALLALTATGCTDDEPARDPSSPTPRSSVSVPTGQGNGDVTGSFGDVDLDGDWVVTCLDRSDGSIQVSARGRGGGLQAVRALVDGDAVTGVSISFEGRTGTNREGSGVVLESRTDGWSLSGQLEVDDEQTPFDVRVECRAPIR